MRPRTKGEQKAYLDGYEMCGECLEDYLTDEGKQRLECLLMAVRSAVEIDDEENESKEMSKEKTIRVLEALENDFLYDDEGYADDSKEYKDTVIALRMAIDMLKQESKTGYWEREIISLPLSDSSKGCYKCSNCNTHWEYAFKHCPNCGAKMKSEEE